MPLIKSSSKRAVGKNIKEMMSFGHPRAQAVAAALDNQRRYTHKQDGGAMASMGAPVPSSSTSPYDPWMYMALMGGGAGDSSMATMGAPVQPITPVPATYRHGGYVYKDDGGSTDASSDVSGPTATMSSVGDPSWGQPSTPTSDLGIQGSPPKVSFGAGLGSVPSSDVLGSIDRPGWFSNYMESIGGLPTENYVEHPGFLKSNIPGLKSNSPGTGDPYPFSLPHRFTDPAPPGYHTLPWNNQMFMGLRRGGYVHKDGGGSTSDSDTSGEKDLDNGSNNVSFGNPMQLAGLTSATPGVATRQFIDGPDMKPPGFGIYDPGYGPQFDTIVRPPKAPIPGGGPDRLDQTSPPLLPLMQNFRPFGRRAMMAEGGSTHRGQNPDVTSPPTRQDMALQVGMTPRGPVVGLIKSPVPGRTDRLPMQVYDDSYVIPADVVSNGYGQGNTEAGARILEKMVGPHFERGAKNAPHLIKRGTVPIVAAGGEFVVHPFAVASWGGGDPAKGHKALDNMVKTRRKEAALEQLKLPGPKKN